MNTLYLDLSSGISGDMILGALLDAGLDIRELERELSKLGLKGYQLRRRKVRRQGLSGTKVNIQITNYKKDDFKAEKLEKKRW